MTGADRHSQQTRCVSLAHRRRTAKISGDRRHLQTALENEQAITAIDVGVQFPEQSIYRLEPSGWRQASADRLRVCWCTQAGSRGSGSARWHSPAPRARAELSRFPVQQLQFEPGHLRRRAVWTVLRTWSRYHPDDEGGHSQASNGQAANCAMVPDLGIDLHHSKV